MTFISRSRRRKGAVLLTLLATACGPDPEPAPDLPTIPCAHAKAPLDATCTIERAGSTIIVRHPDGAFRRFTQQGGTFTTEGAVQPHVTKEGRNLLVEMEGDRYLLPSS